MIDLVEGRVEFVFRLLVREYTRECIGERGIKDFALRLDIKDLSQCLYKEDIIQVRVEKLGVKE